MEIIAEIGINHNKDLSIARAMILKSQKCGADWVKFQVSLNSFKSIPDFKTYEWEYLFRLCDDIQMPWFASTFNKLSIDFMLSIGLHRWKIPSGMALFTSYIKYLAKNIDLGDGIILSTGLSSIWDIEDGIKVLKDYGHMEEDITISHCVSLYPTYIPNINLGAIAHLRQKFPGHPIGLSDHSLKNFINVLAYGMGYDFIERHVTLDRRMSGPDHSSSITFQELKQLVDSIHECRVAYGTDNKVLPTGVRKAKEGIVDKMREPASTFRQ